jgi:beta-mannosidase
MINKKHILSLIVVLTLYNCKESQNIPLQLNLDQNWEFKNVTDSIWFAAEVPGEVHSDLIRNNLIEDPFVKDNEFKLQWISEKDWEYKTQFTIDDKTFNKNNIELKFEGLDTYASVYLNDSLILKSNNAFREWNVDVKSIIKTENDLKIVFDSTTKQESIEKEKTPYFLPPGDRVFTRKAQYQYGWDWGPIFNTSGIWRPITLKAWDNLIIKDVYIQDVEINTSKANLVANFDVNTSIDKEVTIEVFINDSLHTSHLVNIKNISSFPIKIENPKLWWTHNLGEPYLYNLKFVIKDGNTILDKYHVKKGIRTIELVSEKDSIGQSFYFKLNNVPVFMKGANYIPQHSFQNQITFNRYNQLLDDTVDANMNMLRIWGGGIYENNIFYDLCDEKGILIWQDFMYACAMYPGDDAFLKNIEEEAIDNIKRLRNHASIALWCGNNENDEAWKNWGWQQKRSEEEKKEVWDAYLKVFDSILPNSVKTYANTIDYWASSPLYGRMDPKFKTHGDAHDWWLWHSAYPFEHLQDNVPRFMSEFGFQSFPSFEAIKYATQNDSIDISSEAFATHQKHPRGFKLIREYMERDFPVPTNDEDYVYMSQVLQAYGMTMGFEAQRRAMPYNMGTLYWQLNDCWPVASWSGIDNFGNWKALHYKTKKAFEDVLISSRITNDTIKTYIVNDKLEDLNGTLNLKIIDFNGNILWIDSKVITVQANKSELFYELPLLNIGRSNSILIANFNDTSSLFYLDRPKHLKLEKADITQKVTKSDSGFNIELTSNTLQKEVFLFTNEKGFFNDNFIDLLPNEKQIIEFKTEAKSIDDLKIKTLNMFVN